MTTLEQIKQKQQELNQMIEEYEQSQNTPSEYGWKPEHGDLYYYIDSYGFVIQDNWDSLDCDTYRFSIGNCFPDQEQAEKYKLRLESMKPKYLPKLEESFWIAAANSDSITPQFVKSWKGTGSCSHVYFMGRTFKTEQEAQDWITNYAKAWEI